MFALEICVNDKQSGDILLNPGSYKLPKPHTSNIKYKFWGYVMAEDQEVAETIFEGKRQQKTNKEDF